MCNFMCKCVIMKTDRGDYRKMILFLSDENILTYLLCVREKLQKENFEGKVLLDQLFTVGNGDNRFVELPFINDEFHLESSKIVNPSEYFRKKIIDFLHDNYYFVENSILTDEQRKAIKAGEVF